MTACPTSSTFVGEPSPQALFLEVLLKRSAHSCMAAHRQIAGPSSIPSHAIAPWKWGRRVLVSPVVAQRDPPSVVLVLFRRGR
jgi:hypothetical protein